MSHHHALSHDNPLPRSLLIAAGALIALTIVAAAAGRLTGFGRAPQVEAASSVQRELRFEDRADGGVAVIDAASGRLAHVLPPGHDGFVRATLRGLARERLRRGIGADVAFVLSARADGGLTLEDPAIERRIDLGAFGPTNAAAFARLLDDRKETP